MQTYELQKVIWERRRDEIIEERRKGLTYREIASKFQISRQRAEQIFRTHGKPK